MDVVAQHGGALSQSARLGYEAKGIGCVLSMFLEKDGWKMAGMYLSRDELMNWPLKEDTLKSFRTMLDLYDPQTQMVVVVAIEEHIVGSGILVLV